MGKVIIFGPSDVKQKAKDMIDYLLANPNIQYKNGMI